MERAARAQDRALAAAPPARLLRTLCERPAERADDEEPAEAPHCHMLSFPAFVPSALMASYVGVRIGGGFQSASFQPFSTIDGSYTRALGSGALELSKEVIAERVAVLGSLSGGVATGANAGTLLGGGASLGGGVDVGLAVGRPIGGAGQIALIGRVTQRNGTTLVVERALTALPQNPINQKVVDVAGFLGTAAGRIAVPYRESGQRLDAAWALAATPLVSVQLAIGIEHRYRYYRSDDPSAAGNLREIAAPRFGVAVGVDLSSNLCGSRCVPLAFLLEYQLSPTHQWVEVLQPGRGREDVYSRFVDHVAALGMHYASDRHADLDASITAYAHLNVPPELALDPGTGLVPPRTREFGAQAMARYLW
jgi:hypothetical protein